MGKKKIIIIVLLLLVYSTAFYIYSKAQNYFNNSENVLTLNNSSFSDGETDLSYRCLSAKEAGIFSYSSDFQKSDLPSSATEEYSIVVYRMSGQSFKVYLNDTYLGVAGDYEGVRSSIWNGMFVFEFDKRILRENNKITLEIVGLYDIGLKKFPVIVVENTEGMLINEYYQILQVWLKAICIGVLLSGSIIMLAFYLSFFDSPRRSTFLLMSLALFLVIFYFIDFFSLSLIPINFTLYKKINVTAIFVVFAIANFSFINYFKMSKWKIIPYSTLAISICGAIFAKNIQQFKSWYDIYFLMLPINLGALMIMMTIKKVRFQTNYILSICNFSLIVILVPAVLNLTFKMHLDMFYCTIHIFLIPASISVIVVIMNELQRLRFTVNKENKKLKYLYNKSITDGLTGLYNYSFMLEYLQKINPVYSVILFDIDNLKEINDTLGHLAGNKAIIMVRDVLKDLLPKNSVVGRFGGDEFMVIIFDNEDIAMKVMERARLRISCSKLLKSDLKVSISIGMYVVTEAEIVEKIIDNADQAMYHAKKTGKNCLVNYDKMREKNNINS